MYIINLSIGTVMKIINLYPFRNKTDFAFSFSHLNGYNDKLGYNSCATTISVYTLESISWKTYAESIQFFFSFCMSFVA